MYKAFVIVVTLYHMISYNYRKKIGLGTQKSWRAANTGYLISVWSCFMAQVRVTCSRIGTRQTWYQQRKCVMVIDTVIVASNCFSVTISRAMSAGSNETSCAR